MNALNLFEIGILDFIRETFSCKFLDYFFMAVTTLSNKGFFWIILAVVLLCFKKTRKTGICLGVALLIGEIVGNQILKKLFERPRPYTVNQDITLIIERLTSFSFPSGHSRCAVECSIAVFANNKKWGIAAIVLAVLTCLSRMYLYVHFPSDIVAGVMIGVMMAFLAKFITERFPCFKGYNSLKEK